MANRLAETGLPWEPEDLDLARALHAPRPRPKTLVQRGPVLWVGDGDSWQANIGRWSAHVSRSAKEPPAWEWRAFAVHGSRPRAVGGRAWSDREAAQKAAEKALAEQE